MSKSSNQLLRRSIYNLYFAMSDNNNQLLIENIGFGLASGFLPMSLLEDNNETNRLLHNNTTTSTTTSTTTNNIIRDDINVVTGQKLCAEQARAADVHKKEMEPMTQEEKEIEAERLFVLFERLERTGVVNVKNPVRTALENGDFEE